MNALYKSLPLHNKPILLAGCFSNNGTYTARILQKLGIPMNPNEFAPKENNCEHLLARMHSNHLIKLNGGNWIYPQAIQQFLNSKLDEVDLSGWIDYAQSLARWMTQATNSTRWAWKDTRLPLTIRAWSQAFDAQYIVTYETPESSVEKMKHLRSKGLWGFRHLSDKKLLQVWELYHNHLLDFLQVHTVSILGINWQDDNSLSKLGNFLDLQINIKTPNSFNDNNQSSNLTYKRLQEFFN